MLSPYRIVEDCGTAFAMGAIGGGIFNTIKGFRNSPRGERWQGTLTAIKQRTPISAGNFAAWGLTFSSFDCALIALRGKEDPWNSIGSGAAAGALLAARGGPKMAAQSAIFGGALLGLMELAGIMMNRMYSEEHRPPQPEK